MKLNFKSGSRAQIFNCYTSVMGGLFLVLPGASLAINLLGIMASLGNVSFLNGLVLWNIVSDLSKGKGPGVVAKE